MNKQLSARPKILCVDDDPVALALYVKFLGGDEYQLTTAESAEKGLAMAKKEVPDLIISDIVMNGMDGITFCNQVKNDPRTNKSFFILASSSHVREADILDALNTSADDYLRKPLSQKTLIAKVRSFLRIKTLQNDLLRTNHKMGQALKHLKGYKRQVEEKNTALEREKQMLQNSLKQISLMAEEREQTNRKLVALSEVQSENFQNLVKVLSTIIESRRQYHRGHSKKVAEIATFIAAKMKLAHAEIRQIETAALLHELGKLSIPDELAMKNPAEYTQQEKDFLAQHPVKGASQLEGFSDFKKIAKFIRHFHENIDGSGQPDGLRNKQIPIGSRIIAVANLFDNLVFRDQNGDVQKALEVIDAQVGVRFDPGVVRFLYKYTQEQPDCQAPDTKEMNIYELAPGMILAGGIYTLSGTMLLPVNTVLTDASIKRIAQYHRTEPIEETVFVKS